MRMLFAAIGVAAAVWVVNCSQIETARSLPVGIKRHLRSKKFTQANEEERTPIDEIVRCVTELRLKNAQVIDHQKVTASVLFEALALEFAPKTNVLLFLIRLARVGEYLKRLKEVNSGSHTTLATFLKAELSNSHPILIKVARWISKSPQELKWLQEKIPPEQIFEDLKRGGGDPFLHPDISKWTNYVEVYNDLHPESVKPMMTLMEYKEDELIEKVTLGLETDTVYNSLRKRVLNELFQTWTNEEGKLIRPADAYIRLGLNSEDKKDVKFTSPKFAVWTDYVDFFNTGKVAEDRVSYMSVLQLKIGVFDVVEQLVKTDVKSVNHAHSLVSNFSRYLAKERMTHLDSIDKYDECLKSLSTWLTAPTNKKRKREA